MTQFPNQNFDPIYQALATLIVNSATVNFTGDLVTENPNVANVPAELPLVPGLAIVGDQVPIGTTILSYDPTTGALVMSQGALSAGTGVSLRGGFQSLDVTQTRLLKHWTDVLAPQQPVVFVTQTGETSDRRPGQLTKWTLECLIYIYCQAPNDRTPVAPALNALLGAVRGVVSEPDASGIGRAQNRNTLGGLVFDVGISGSIETDEGYLGQQGVAKVPVRIIQNGP